MPLGKPNASILNFFKKEPKPEEGMFLGDAAVLPASQEEERESLYDVEPELVAMERYNEVTASVKRRKLEEDCVEIEHSQVGREGVKAAEVAIPRKKVSKRGPFLDSDDESSDDEATKTPTKTKLDHPEMTLPEEKHSIHSQEADASPIAVEASTYKPDPPVKPLLGPTTTAVDSEAAPVSNGDRSKLETESSLEEFGDLDNLDFAEDEDFEGEEFRERRFMEEQARLEAEEEGNYSCDESIEQTSAVAATAECCPICSSSLAGISPDEATVHVNACLDGNPTSLTERPTLKGDTSGPLEVDAPAISKRFARAAQPRPGQANPISLGNPATGTSSAFSKLMSGHAEDAAWASAAAAEHSSRGLPAYKRTCPFYKIMPGMAICVDAFRYGAVEGCRAYFLSHFHSDHYVGLTSSWCHGPIYCSKVTGSLVKSQLRTAANWVIELEFEETVDVPGIDGVRVTMIPANHCPGSSLFLFERTVRGKQQRILHCGDFRACPAQVEHPLLRPDVVDAVSGKTRQQKIDICYLDTTYLNPRYSFPPQEEVISACAALCAELNEAIKQGDDERWEILLRTKEGGLQAKDVSKFFTSDKPPPPPRDALNQLGQPRPRLLVVCGTYSIGKERICKAVALALGSKIFASPAKIRIVNQLGDPELSALMTSDPREAQVHMQMLMEMRADTLADYLTTYKPHFSRVLGFRPSGWNFRGTGAPATLSPPSLGMEKLLHGAQWRTRFGARDIAPQRGSTREAVCAGVPYSEHSSFRELCLFLMALRIERVVPTVNVGSESSRRRMRGWTERWVAERRRGGLVRLVGMDEAAGGEGEVDGKEDLGMKRAKMWDGKGSGGGGGGGVVW
jgi:DNA cross-link repair 1A protein